MPTKTKSQQQWLQRQKTDIYTRSAKKDGYRARSAYKLVEILDKYPHLRSANIAVDLGAAPGSWSEILKEKTRVQKIYALDILYMEPLHDVTFIQGDFTDESVLAHLESEIPTSIDLVLSDMAPNISGIRVRDQAMAMSLADMALEFALAHLHQGGHFVVKLFQGDEFDDYVKNCRQYFTKVQLYKPKSSRAESREVFLIGSSCK